jgi:ribosome-binding ATPase YchF (GTP1/OBG family)
VSVILHLLRCFDDVENNMVTHVDGSVDPIRDLDTIETEAMADQSHT